MNQVGGVNRCQAISGLRPGRYAPTPLDVQGHAIAMSYPIASGTDLVRVLAPCLLAVPAAAFPDTKIRYRSRTRGRLGVDTKYLTR